MEYQNFVHQPLNQKTDEIRLLNILPSEDPTAPIECQILHVRLSQLPSYEALSYMWGNGDESQHILIRGEKYGVRENLSLALKQLRLERTTRCLWIDAICINQTDTAERNHQVDQMSLIFSQAARVVVWLGQSTKDSDDTLSFIAQVNEGLRVEFVDYPEQQFLRYWTGYDLLCARPYWTRLWIIQEVALATRIILCCGSLEVDWGQFIRFYRILQLWIEYPRLSLNTYPPLARTSTIPQRLSKIRLLNWPEVPSCERNSHLLDLLFEFNESQCKDIRDRIFGLLSLASKCCRDSMPVDYSKSPFDVCQSALRHHLQCHCPQDTAAAMKSAYSANSVLKEKDSTFRYARVIYTIPFSTTLPEYRIHTSDFGSFSMASMQEIYYECPLWYMGCLATNENRRDIEATYMRNRWEKKSGWEIQNFIHRLLCWYYGSPTRDEKPPTWSKKYTGEIRLALDENGFMAVTNTNIQIGDRLFDKWSEKQQSQFRMDKDPIRDLSYHFLRTSKLGHTT